MTLLIIYIATALIFFIAIEAISVLECKKDNAHFEAPVFRPPHLKMVICAAFFPIAILSAIVAEIIKSIGDMRELKKDMREFEKQKERGIFNGSCL